MDAHGATLVEVQKKLLADGYGLLELGASYEFGGLRESPLRRIDRNRLPLERAIELVRGSVNGMTLWHEQRV
jgi:hypothetical protein